jgi:hypothetical protein
MLSKINFKPGFYKESTEYHAGPTWYDGDKVRFRKGMPESIGGWQKYPLGVIFPQGEDGGAETGTFRGVCRSLYDWGTAESVKYIGIGTNLKFYVETGGTASDITPIRSTTSAGDVTFSATSGSSSITVSDTGHGAVPGDYVSFSGAVSLGGNITATVLNHEYEVDTIIDADSYTITARNIDQTEVTANVSDSGNGGASVVGAYQLNSGTNTYLQSTGYGVGDYGDGPYSGAGTLSFAGQLRLWTQDAFGDDLIFCPRGGPIYFWDESGGVDARAVILGDLSGASNAPVIALQIMVSPVDRHVIALGTNAIGSSTVDPLLVRWADQETVTNWTPSATNTAGAQVLSSGTGIVGAVKTRHEILIFTDTSLTSMRFSGEPYIFQFAVVAENISMISPNAAASTGDAVFFMDIGGFYVYNGTVERLNCDVLSYVYENLDRDQGFKVFTANNPDNNEVTWFYPSGDSGTSEINSYVTYNYKENCWTTGTFERGAWSQAQTKSYPIASTCDVDNVKENYLLYHEIGYNGEGAAINSYIESGKVSIEDGDRFAFVKRLLPDFAWHGASENADMAVKVMGADFSMDEPTTLAEVTVNEDTKQNHVRVRARDVVLRFEANGSGYGWTMGGFRIDLRTDGMR